MDKAGFHNVKIVVGDDFGWDLINWLNKDPVLARDVDIIGVHYPGTRRCVIVAYILPPA